MKGPAIKQSLSALMQYPSAFVQGLQKTTAALSQCSRIVFRDSNPEPQNVINTKHSKLIR
jgi:arginine/lysine/ornithine decarboxylase